MLKDRPRTRVRLSRQDPDWRGCWRSKPGPQPKSKPQEHNSSDEADCHASQRDRAASAIRRRRPQDPTPITPQALAGGVQADRERACGAALTSCRIAARIGSSSSGQTSTTSARAGSRASLAASRVSAVSEVPGEPRELLVVAGHLPWAEIKARDESLGTFQDDWKFCFQSGCAEPAVSTYLLKAEWCSHCGKKGRENPAMGLGKGPARRFARRFCRYHLRRGDAGLNDSDNNYVVDDGPGPGEGEPAGDKIKPSGFAGVIQAD